MSWIALVSFGTLVIAILILHKVRRVHLQGFKISEDLRCIMTHLADLDGEISRLYDQLQCYEDLIRVIQPVQPLPILRGWAASPDFLLEVCRHALRARPQTIIECGSGASTLALARCCQLNELGHVYSLEHDAHYAAQTRIRLQEQGLDAWATVRTAPLMPQPTVEQRPWYSTANLSLPAASCTLLIIDGPPGDTAPLARYPALPLLLHWLAENCTIYLDDANRQPERESVSRWLREYPDWACEQMHCEKGCAKLTRTSAIPASSNAGTTM